MLTSQNYPIFAQIEGPSEGDLIVCIEVKYFELKCLIWTALILFLAYYEEIRGVAGRYCRSILQTVFRVVAKSESLAQTLPIYENWIV